MAVTIPPDRPFGEKIALGVMLLRGVLYFLVRLRRPQLVLMGRGARIKGLRNIEFAGPAKIGAYTLIDARYCSSVRLGRNFSLGDFSTLLASGSRLRCPGITMGDNVSFGQYCHIGGGFGLTIEANCLFGPYASLHPESHVTTRMDVPIKMQGVTGTGIRIGEDNWFGAKATVLDGVILGSGNIIAAGAILTRGSFDSHTLYAGVPAKEIGRRK